MFQLIFAWELAIKLNELSQNSTIKAMASFKFYQQIHCQKFSILYILCKCEMLAYDKTYTDNVMHSWILSKINP